MTDQCTANPKSSLCPAPNPCKLNKNIAGCGPITLPPTIALPKQQPVKPKQSMCSTVIQDPAEAEAAYRSTAALFTAANVASRTGQALAQNLGKPLTPQRLADQLRASMPTPADLAPLFAQPQHGATHTSCQSSSSGNDNVSTSKKDKGNKDSRRLSKSYRQIADAFNATVADVRDAIHAAKRYGHFGGARSNPDVMIDLNTGEIYVDLGNGQASNDSIGNLQDYLP